MSTELISGGSRILYITLNGKQVTSWDFVGFDVDLAKKPILVTCLSIACQVWDKGTFKLNEGLQMDANGRFQKSCVMHNQDILHYWITINHDYL